MLKHAYPTQITTVAVCDPPKYRHSSRTTTSYASCQPCNEPWKQTENEAVASGSKAFRAKCMVSQTVNTGTSDVRRYMCARIILVMNYYAVNDNNAINLQSLLFDKQFW